MLYMRDLKSLAEQFNYRCIYCLVTKPLRELTREHLKPIRRGGRNGDNIVLACRGCNQSMGGISIEKKMKRLSVKARWKLYYFRQGFTNIYKIKD